MTQTTEESKGKIDTNPIHHRSAKKRTWDSKPDTQTFHGVRRRSWGRYVSEIRLPGQKTRVWLGSFGSPEKAARAYDSAAFFLKGNSANLNFPNSVGSLPRPKSASRRDIQAAAAKAAATATNNNELTEKDVFSQPELEESGWLGMEECCYCEIGTASFEEVKEAPLLSPLRFNVAGELFFCNCHDSADLLTSCLDSYA